VEDVWRGALPAGTELLAGKAGLRREVVWCTALRARAPALDPVRGGELILLSLELLAAVDSRLTLARLVDSLAANGVAALAVSDKAGTDARQRAEAHGLPLFLMPAAVSHLDEIEQQVLRYIVDRRAELHERAQDLHRQLSELALAGRGLNAVLARLTELVGVPVLLERGGILEYVSAGRDRTLPPELAAAITQERPQLEEWLRDVPLSAFDPPVSARSLPGGHSRLVAPILLQGRIGGFLSLVGAEGQLGEVHRLAVGRAAHACAIELVRVDAARDARDELEEELLDVLTGSRPGSPNAAQERARRKGFDLDSPFLVVAGQADQAGQSSRIRSSWERSLSTSRLPALVRERDEVTVALVSLAGKRAPEPKALVDQLHRASHHSVGTLAVGFSGVRTGLSEVSGAAKEAEQALIMGRRLFGSESATAFADLGLYRLLYGLQPLPELRAFHDESLARLKKKDRSGSLLQTLAAYLATNGSPTDAAGRLHLHRNTVLYRLGRIEDILGVDLRDAEVRLSLHLALKVADVLESG
jgi:purine catabolism regulator